MIQISELRVGNILCNKSKNNELCEVSSLNRYGSSMIEVTEHDSGYGYHIHINDLSPVRTTHYILQRLGFAKSPNGVYRKKGFYAFKHPTERTKYLHRIQNLYHSINQTELKVDLPMLIVKYETTIK